jgi:hypothetical protein
MQLALVGVIAAVTEAVAVLSVNVQFVPEPEAKE